MTGRPPKVRHCNYRDCEDVSTHRGRFSYFRNGEWQTGRTAYYCTAHYEIMCERIAKSTNESVRFTEATA